jgi:hypothetical protein
MLPLPTIPMRTARLPRRLCCIEHGAHVKVFAMPDQTTTPSPSERTLRILFAVLAAYHLALGLWMTASPGTFYDVVGPFGTRNDHYLRDVATFYLAFAAGLGIAVRRPSWRVPVVAVVALQYLFHVVNHVVDISKASPGWVGPADVISLALVAALLVWLWRAASGSRTGR